MILAHRRRAERGHPCDIGRVREVLDLVQCAAEVLEATLEEPRGSGPLKTYPLIVRIKPNGELVDRTGTKVGPLGKIVIESDAPNSPRLNQYVSFRLEDSQ